MNERKIDPSSGTEVERHAPGGAQPGGGQPNAGHPATDDGRLKNEAPGVDQAERDVITSGTAATSEVGDPAAHADAERQGDGTPLPADEVRRS
jgi:hypothetical protein